MDIFPFVLFCAALNSNWLQKGHHHAQQTETKSWKFERQAPTQKRVGEAQSAALQNPYGNALIGMGGSSLMKLKKYDNSKAAEQLEMLDDLRINKNLTEISRYDEIFNQMPDPSLHDFRGVSFNENDKLPAQSLVFERDFFGAKASNTHESQTFPAA